MAPSGRSIPEEGDVIVRHETLGADSVYVLQTSSSTGQILHRTRDAAIAQAVRFAKRQRVRAWVTVDSELTLVENFREAEENRPAMHRTLERLRGEFLEMPGLRLTVAQAQRLCGVEPTTCKTILDELVDARFLCVRPDGTYARVGDYETSVAMTPPANDPFKSNRRRAH